MRENANTHESAHRRQRDQQSQSDKGRHLDSDESLQYERNHMYVPDFSLTDSSRNPLARRKWKEDCEQREIWLKRSEYTICPKHVIWNDVPLTRAIDTTQKEAKIQKRRKGEK